MSRVRFLLMGVFAFFVVSNLFAQTDSLNTFRPRTNTVTPGVLYVTMTGASTASPSDSATVIKQVFTGSTNCTTGGGPVTYLNVTPSTSDSTLLGGSDSVLLNPFPTSTNNGQFQYFQNPDAIPTTGAGGSAICVAGFTVLAHTLSAVYAPGIRTLDRRSQAEYYYNAGDPVEVVANGTSATSGAPWHVTLSGGSPSPCSSFPGSTANVTAETQIVPLLLPADNTAIPSSQCPGTTDIRGNWTAQLFDNSNAYKAQITFRVHDINPFANLSVGVTASDLTGNPAFPPTGYIKYVISMGNSGPDVATNASMIATIPAGTAFFSFVQNSGPPMTCSGPTSGQMVCVAGTFPPDQFATFTLVVSYIAMPNNTVLTSTASVNSSATDPQTSNNSQQAPVTISTNTNSGQFICPADILQASSSSSGANVTYATYTTTYTYTGGNTTPSIASGGLFPIGTTVIGWQSIWGNGGCFFNVTVTDGQRPDMTATKTHSTIFQQGQTGQTFTINVKNTGGVSTSGAVTITDNVPAGLVPTAITGTGWTCALSTLSCTRSDSLGANSTYPPITVTVDVPLYTPTGTVTNVASVASGSGGEAITANDQASDNVIIIPPSLAAVATAAGPVNGVVATATATSNVHVTWGGSCIASCHIYRSATLGSWAYVGSAPAVPGASYDDSTVSPNTAYMYKVLAFTGTNESFDGTYDLATTVMYTDDPIVPGTTVIKAVHLQELRTAVNAVRAIAGVPVTFTNPGTPGTVVHAIDLNELRSDLDAVMGAYGFATGGWTDSPLGAGITTIKAIHIQELRNRMK